MTSMSALSEQLPLVKLGLTSGMRTLLTLEFVNFLIDPFLIVAIFNLVQIRKCISKIKNPPNSILTF